MIYKKHVEELFSYCDEAIRAKGDFSPCVIEPLDILGVTTGKFLLLGKEKVSSKEKLANLKLKKSEILEVSDHDLRDAYHDLTNDYKDIPVKTFFNHTPSKVMNSVEKTIALQQFILDKINSENHNELNDYKDKIINSLTELKEIMKDIYTEETNVKLHTKKRDESFINWKDEYEILKLRVKSECVKTNINYKIFFKDML